MEIKLSKSKITKFLKVYLISLIGSIVIVFLLELTITFPSIEKMERKSDHRNEFVNYNSQYYLKKYSSYNGKQIEDMYSRYSDIISMGLTNKDTVIHKRRVDNFFSRIEQGFSGYSRKSLNPSYSSFGYTWYSIYKNQLNRKEYESNSFRFSIYLKTTFVDYILFFPIALLLALLYYLFKWVKPKIKVQLVE